MTIDGEDVRILDRVAAVYSQLDPVPAGLADRISFGITLDALHAEIAELQRSGDLVGVRAEAAPADSQTVTFTSSDLTTMVTITPTGADRVRIDGWVDPGAGVEIELRLPGESLHDGRGRRRPLRLRRRAARPGAVRTAPRQRARPACGVHPVD